MIPHVDVESTKLSRLEKLSQELTNNNKNNK